MTAEDGAAPASAADVERNARAMGKLTQLLQELVALDEEARRVGQEMSQAMEATEDADAFRRAARAMGASSRPAEPIAVQADLLEMFYGHLLVAGNAYLEAVTVAGSLRELHALRPDRMKLVPGADGWPEAHDYSVGGQTVRFRMDGAGVKPSCTWPCSIR